MAYRRSVRSFSTKVPERNFGSALHFSEVSSIFPNSTKFGLEVGLSSTVPSAFAAVVSAPSMKYEQSTSYHYVSAMDRFIATEAWFEALNTAKNMSDAGLEPNLWKLTLSLKECSGVDKSVWREYISLLEHLLSNGHSPQNPEIYSFAMSSCLSSGWSDLVIEIFAKMKAAGVAQQWAYVDAMHAYRIEKNTDASLKTLQEMIGAFKLNDGDYCDVYRLAMETCSESSQWQQVLDLFGSMESGEGRRDVSCFRLALLACQKLQKPDLAVQYLGMILESNLVPDDFCYIYAIQSCADEGNMEQVTSLFVDLVEKRSAQTKKKAWICTTEESTWDCFRIAFTSCLDARAEESAREIVVKMRELLSTGGKQSKGKSPHQISSSDLKRLSDLLVNFCSRRGLDPAEYLSSLSGLKPVDVIGNRA